MTIRSAGAKLNEPRDRLGHVELQLVLGGDHAELAVQDGTRTWRGSACWPGDGDAELAAPLGRRRAQRRAGVCGAGEGHGRRGAQEGLRDDRDHAASSGSVMVRGNLWGTSIVIPPCVPPTELSGIHR